MVKYKAVVFDLFGTLVDNFPPSVFDRVASEMAAAVSVPAGTFIQRWGELFAERDMGLVGPLETSVEEVCHCFGAKPSAEQITAAAQLWIDLIRRILTPRMDAARTLAHLKACGYKTALISNCGWEVPKLWQATPVAPLIDVRVYSCAVCLTKPDPRIYQLACERLGVRPEDCLYVGDGSDGELTGAAHAGMDAVLIRVPYEPLDDLYLRYHPDVKGWQGSVISALCGVLGLLDEEMPPVSCGRRRTAPAGSSPPAAGCQHRSL